MLRIKRSGFQTFYAVSSLFPETVQLDHLVMMSNYQKAKASPIRFMAGIMPHGAGFVLRGFEDSIAQNLNQNLDWRPNNRYNRIGESDGNRLK